MGSLLRGLRMITWLLSWNVLPSWAVFKAIWRTVVLSTALVFGLFLTLWRKEYSICKGYFPRLVFMSSRLLPVECNFTEVFTSLNQIPVFYVSFPLSSFSLILTDFMSMELRTESYQIKNYKLNDCEFKITVVMCYCCKKEKIEPYFVDNRE